MPIIFNSNLSSTVANNTWLDKTIDDLKKGKLGLYKVTPLESEAIEDVQNALNEIFDTVGMAGEGDPNRKIYSSTNYIIDGESHKTNIGILDQEVANNFNDIDNLYTIQENGEYKIKAFADDAAYMTAHGTPPYTTFTAIYYNTTSGLIRYYDGVSASWKDVGTSAVGQHENIGTGNGVTVDFSISYLPLTEDSIIVFRNGLLVPRSEYTFSNPTITFSTAPAAAQRIDVWMLTDGTPSVSVTPSGTLVVEYYELLAGDITAKEITLPSTPSDPTKVLLDIIGGSAQEYGVDFSVSGTTLTWNSLGLDGVLIAGDKLRYWYFTA